MVLTLANRCRIVDDAGRQNHTPRTPRTPLASQTRPTINSSLVPVAVARALAMVLTLANRCRIVDDAGHLKHVALASVTRRAPRAPLAYQTHPSMKYSLAPVAVARVLSIVLISLISLTSLTAGAADTGSDSGPATESAAVQDGEQTGQIISWQHRGIKVYHFPVAQLPIVDVRLQFRAGSAANTDNSASAWFASQMIGRGTKSLKEDELDQKLGLIGARFHRGVNRDSGWVGVRTLSKHSPAALELLSQIISEPRWQKDSIELLREQNRVGTERALENASSRLSIETFKLLYGDHPYAHMVSGDLDDNKKINLAQIKQFYLRHYNTANMRVLAVGDIDRTQINAWLDALIKRLPAGSAVKPPPWVKNTPLPFKHHTVIDSSSQIHWNAVSLGLTRSNTDYPLLTLAMFALDKRIDKILRDELGLTYSAGAGSLKLSGRGMLTVRFSTRAQGIGVAVGASKKITRQFFQTGLGAEELQRAVIHLTGLLSISYNSNARILELMHIIAQEDLPVDYLGRLIGRIAQASPDEINEFIHRYFSNRGFSEISAGAAIPKAGAAAGRGGSKP